MSVKHVPSSEWFKESPETAFADGFPFLILLQASVDEFSKQSPVSTRNFRPNIVVEGWQLPNSKVAIHIKRMNGLKLE